MKKEGLYAAWHDDPYHHVFQWVILLLVVVVAGGLMYVRIRDESQDEYGVFSLAAGTPVAITSPAPGTTVSGLVPVSVVIAAGPNVVRRAELYRDGQLLQVDNTAPYVFEWNTAMETNASHTLQVKAYDGQNRVATSNIVPVTVFNKVIPAKK